MGHTPPRSSWAKGMHREDMALVCFAFALVLLWGAVWFAIWSVGGLIRGIVRLGGKWCYKEAEQ